MKIGDAIKKYRKEKGLTQTELAELLETTQYVITNYERNLRKPAADKIPDIANALNVTLDQLYGVTEKTDDSKPRTAPNTRGKQIQEIFEQLPPTDQRAVIKHAKGLLKE